MYELDDLVALAGERAGSAGKVLAQGRAGRDEVGGGGEVGGEGAADAVAQAGQALGVDQQRLPALHAVAGMQDGHGAGAGQRRALRRRRVGQELEDLREGGALLEAAAAVVGEARSAGRRVGKECVSTWTIRWWPGS